MAHNIGQNLVKKAHAEVGYQIPDDVLSVCSFTYCQICSVVMKSPAACKSHYQGQPHFKKLATAYGISVSCMKKLQASHKKKGTFTQRERKRENKEQDDTDLERLLKTMAEKNVKGQWNGTWAE